jgi:C4-dicarboxylate-specific signal transduction histidine kinase
MGDRILLKHLLLNLITNALQAMEEMRRGEKLIEIDLRADQGEAQITVRDRGPGLAMASAGKQFEPFFTTKPGGMGLGLSICRSIVELHEGNISLSNHPEGGAKVALSLPVGMPCDPIPA